MSQDAGRCQCGDVRYVTEGEPLLVALCHCRMCRRAHAAPAVAWAMYAQEQGRCTVGQPAHYASSAEAQRGFCARCGTQISFNADYIPGLVDLAVGSFDAPERLPPALHCWEAERLPWLEFDDGLPRHAQFPPHD